MKIFIQLLVLYAFSTKLLLADIETGYQIIESKMKPSECLKKSKLARESIEKDSHGEFIDDENYTYTYITDNASITVLCLSKKEKVIIFVAVEDGEAMDFLATFFEHITGTVHVWNEEPKE